MANVQAHYANLLAEHYTWMLGGDLERVAAEDRALLEQLGIVGPRRPNAVAVDLGSGPGPQTLALSDMGFSTVFAVDTSQELLDELAGHARSRPAVRTLNMDLLDALPSVAAQGSLEAVVCMRDTVLCLPDRSDVVLLIERVAESLAEDGRFVLTYRDLTQDLVGVDRFFPVRSAEDRIMLCALDFGPEQVTVSDLVYTREENGWEFRKSSYEKLRVAPDWLSEQIKAVDLEVVHHGAIQRGMWATVAEKTGQG
jgi:SAM-dependent methyltransferase